MKFKKLSVLLLSSIILSTTLLFTGCGKEEKEVINIVSEYSINDISEYSVYLPKEEGKKVDKEVLMAKLEQIVEEKGENQKGIMVKFFEYKDEGNFSDLKPYAVAAWAPKDGFDKAATQINSRNNVYRVEVSSEKAVVIEDKSIEIYKELLKEFKDSNKTFSQNLTLYTLQNIGKIEETFAVETDEFLEHIKNMLDRYDGDALTSIKTGN